MELVSIGLIRSVVYDGKDEGWGKVFSEIHVAEKFHAGLQGIDQFSHIVVVFYMHEANFDPEIHLHRHPQDRDDMPELGIFAQRAKHRPNPIGITAVELISHEGGVLRVRGLDAVDGTPVLDIKPYFPQFDRIESPSVPEWVGRLMENYF